MLLRRHSLIESGNPKVLLEVISRVGTVVKAPKDTENGLPIPKVAGFILIFLPDMFILGIPRSSNKAKIQSAEVATKSLN